MIDNTLLHQDSSLEYVIYCRKSTDEKSWKQVQSIPDQIRICMKYAKDNNLSIMKKPDKFDFETNLSLEKEDLETSIVNRRIYLETRWLFIIKEQQSAKTPGIRKKRKKLMKLVETWKVKWILSYAPDRQARNIMEWWELINFVDQEKVTLKYTNFFFEPNASGKMMLWIWFVFSKQYSDKLSEDTMRWMYAKHMQGKAIWTYKHGYLFHASWHHQKHPVFFDLWKKAFKFKIYENKSDVYIANWLRNKWYVKQKYDENGRVREEKEFNEKNMKRIRLDTFYYGLYEYWENQIDLRDNEINPDYEPMISEEEYIRLLEVLDNNKKKASYKTIKDENILLMPLPQWFVKSPDWTSLSFYVVTKNRFRKKLKKLQVENPDLILADVVESKHIRYRNAVKKSSSYGTEVKYEQIELLIIEALDSMKIDDKTYEKFVLYFKTQYDKREEERKLELHRTNLALSGAEHRFKQHVLQVKPNDMTVKEQEIYGNERKRLESVVKSLEADVKELKKDSRNKILEFIAFCDLFKDTSKKFKKATYVQKRKITQLLFLNITITDDSQVIIRPKPELEGLFSQMGRPTGLEPAIPWTTTRCFTD